jgi:hypothetical protein
VKEILWFCAAVFTLKATSPADQIFPLGEALCISVAPAAETGGATEVSWLAAGLADTLGALRVFGCWCGAVPAWAVVDHCRDVAWQTEFIFAGNLATLPEGTGYTVALLSIAQLGSELEGRDMLHMVPEHQIELG